MFFVNVPIGVATFVFGVVPLDSQVPPHPGRLDGTGLALSGLGLGSVMYGISEGPEPGLPEQADSGSAPNLVIPHRPMI